MIIAEGKAALAIFEGKRIGCHRVQGIGQISGEYVPSPAGGEPDGHVARHFELFPAAGGKGKAMDNRSSRGRDIHGVQSSANDPHIEDVTMDDHLLGNRVEVQMREVHETAR